MSERASSESRPWHRRPRLLVGLGLGASLVATLALGWRSELEFETLMVGLALPATLSLRALVLAVAALRRKEPHAARDVAWAVFGLAFPLLVFLGIVAFVVLTFRLPSA